VFSTSKIRQLPLQTCHLEACAIIWVDTLYPDATPGEKANHAARRTRRFLRLWCANNPDDKEATYYTGRIAVVRSAVVGYSIYAVDPPARATFLLDLTVHRGWLRKGVGKELLARLIDHRVRIARDHLLATVREDNLAAQLFLRAASGGRMVARPAARVGELIVEAPLLTRVGTLMPPDDCPRYLFACLADRPPSPVPAARDT
jgi:GNAT superfamily N-acetyltransferase